MLSLSPRSVPMHLISSNLSPDLNAFHSVLIEEARLFKAQGGAEPGDESGDVSTDSEDELKPIADEILPHNQHELSSRSAASSVISRYMKAVKLLRTDVFNSGSHF